MITMIPITEKLNILAVYDNGGETIDRYTIIFDAQCPVTKFYDMLALGSDVTSPQGFSQWTEGCYETGPEADNSHLGKLITFSHLPQSLQDHIEQRVKNP